MKRAAVPTAQIAEETGGRLRAGILALASCLPRTLCWVLDKDLFPEHLVGGGMDGWMDGWMRCLNLDGRVPISDSVKWLKLPPHPRPLPVAFSVSVTPFPWERMGPRRSRWHARALYSAVCSV